MSKFTIVYDANSDATGIMYPTTVTYGEVTRLTSNTFDRSGYTFLGWYGYRLSDNKMCYEDAQGAKRHFYVEGKQPENWTPHLYKNSCGVAKLSTVDSDVVVMKAQWEAERIICACPDRAEDNKEILRRKLLTRPIVLFGGGQRCKNFYQKYYKILNIRCIVTDKKDEKDIVLNDGRTVKIEPYNKDKINPDDYIIVCRPVKIWFDEAYEKSRNILSRDGFKHLEDFLRIGIARMLLENRKLWLWMGFCQYDTLRDIFGKIATVCKDYVGVGIRVGKDTISSSYKYQDCIDMLMICDVLTYTPLIFAEGKVDFDYRNYLPKDAQALSVPRIAFRGYYPYKDSDIDTHHKYTYDGNLHWPFSYAENAIDELVLAGMSNDDIYAEVMRDDFISETEIRRNLKLALKSIQISEKTADIKIFDFIQKNFTERMMYRDGLHYQNFMYFEIARRIARSLGINCEDELNDLEKQTEEQGIEFIDFTEIPILPCVAKTLGLKFITDETLYRVRFTDKGIYRGAEVEMRELTRKEWIYAYADYTRAQIVLKSLWNIESK